MIVIAELPEGAFSGGRCDHCTAQLARLQPYKHPAGFMTLALDGDASATLYPPRPVQATDGTVVQTTGALPAGQIWACDCPCHEAWKFANARATR